MLVRIGVPEHFATVYLPEILAEFSSTHPKILLKVEYDLTLKLLSRFRNKEFDIVLLKMASPQDLTNGVEVWKQELVWVAKNQSILELEREFIPLVFSPEPCVFRAKALEALEKEGKK